MTIDAETRADEPPSPFVASSAGCQQRRFTSGRFASTTALISPVESCPAAALVVPPPTVPLGPATLGPPSPDMSSGAVVPVVFASPGRGPPAGRVPPPVFGVAVASTAATAESTGAASVEAVGGAASPPLADAVT